MNEPLLYEEALNAFIRYHKNHPDVYDDNGRWIGTRIWVQPSRSLSKVTWKYVYLNNINGLLAKYNRQKKEIII
jgi:hypothetical protein